MAKEVSFTIKLDDRGATVNQVNLAIAFYYPI